MITKKENSKKRKFKGVEFELLSSGQKSMITKMNYKTGDSYMIPENVNHRIEVIDAGEVIDIFTPPREDYM